MGVGPEMVAYIPGNKPHQIRPTSDELLHADVQAWRGGVPADKLDWRKINGVNTEKGTRTADA